LLRQHGRAIGFAEHCVCHVRAALRFTHSRNLRAGPPDSRERAARKKFRSKRRKSSKPCRKSGSGRKEKQTMRHRFKADPKWITIRYPAQCAEANCQTEINSGERAFYYPSDKSLYGTRCGHGEKAERDFNAHRIDEDGF
jgi:hypothetical protein